MLRAFEDDLRDARLERALFVMEETIKALYLVPPPITGGLIYEPCSCPRFPCRHSGSAVFPLHYYR